MMSRTVQIIKANKASAEDVLRVAAYCRVSTDSEDQVNSFIAQMHYYYSFMENNTLIPVPEDAEIVIRIYKEYLSGMGVSKIVSGLNSDPEVSRKSWTKEGVRYILANEKYIGDSIFQKTFTTTELPFKKHINRGEVEKYYISDTHEAIMDRELHSAVQEMLCRNAEKQAKKAKPRKFNFSNRIFCSSCGWTYKRRIQHGIVYWVCAKDGACGQQCDTKPVSEEALCKTFVNFYNRLRLHENMILRSTVTKLSEIKKVITCSDSKIGDIDRRIGELVQQHGMYQSLNEQKLMDAVTYAEASTKIDRQLAKLRDQRKKLLREDDDERSIDEIRQLRNNLENAPKAILMFDQALFELLIDRVTVEAGDALTFTLKGGMRLREAIAWN